MANKTVPKTPEAICVKNKTENKMAIIDRTILSTDPKFFFISLSFLIGYQMFV